MQLDNYLTKAVRRLEQAGIGTARLDVLVLLEDLLGTDRASLLAHPEIELTAAHLKKLDAAVERRMTHEPLAYIRGKTEFYGRDFVVDQRVLEPRPESETMIDVLKKLAQDDPSWLHRPSEDNPNDTLRQGTSLADVGSGSGCLGITAALELGLKRVEFFDVDPQTFAVAKTNTRRHKIRGQFYESDLLARDHGPYDIILANLPYVPDTFVINEAAMREPRRAIFGGYDGLDLYRRLFAQLAAKAWQPRFVLTEALPPQHEQLAEIAAAHGFSLLISDDFIQVFTPAKTSAAKT